MQFEPARLGDLGNRADFGERIYGAEIARLGEADRCRLAAMQRSRREPRERVAQRLDADPCMTAGDRNELQPAAEKPGGVCLRGIDVCRLEIGRASCRERV